MLLAKGPHAETTQRATPGSQKPCFPRKNNPKSSCWPERLSEGHRSSPVPVAPQARDPQVRGEPQTLSSVLHSAIQTRNGTSEIIKKLEPSLSRGGFLQWGIFVLFSHAACWALSDPFHSQHIPKIPATCRTQSLLFPKEDTELFPAKLCHQTAAFKHPFPISYSKSAINVHSTDTENPQGSVSAPFTGASANPTF